MTVPKAELHVHLEGTATPALVRRLAARHGTEAPPGTIEGERFVWRDFLDFLDTYDRAASMIRTAEDYRDVTLAYLKRANPEEVAAWIQANNLLRSPPIAVDGFQLYSSHLGSERAHYRVERTYPV